MHGAVRYSSLKSLSIHHLFPSRNFFFFLLPPPSWIVFDSYLFIWLVDFKGHFSWLDKDVSQTNAGERFWWGSPWAGKALCHSALLHQGAAFFTAAPPTGPEQRRGPKREELKGCSRFRGALKGSPGEDKKELERVLLTWVCCLCFDTHAESNFKRGEEGSLQLKLSLIPCGELKNSQRRTWAGTTA